MDHMVDLRNAVKTHEAPKADHLKLNKNEIFWEASALESKPNKIFIIGILGAAVVTFLLSKSILVSIFLSLSAIVLMLHSKSNSRIKNIAIDSHGVHVGENSFQYKELKSFWINYEPGQDKEISLELKKWFIPYVRIALENTNPIEVRSQLVKYIPEKEHEQTIGDLISRKLGL